MEQLTDDEYNLIVEALLFGSCLEITDNWARHDRLAMFDIALKLKHKYTGISNLQIHRLTDQSSIEYEGPSVDTVTASFPSLSVVDYKN